MIQKRSAIIIFVAMLLVVLVIPVTGFSGDSTMLSNPAVLNPNIQKGSGGGVPVGTVITWPVGSNPEDPENWLECNGQPISRTVYPELFAVMGGRVPDYQGLFLRGYGSQSHTQSNGSTVGVTPTLHTSGNLGTVQGDAIRNIYGSFATFGGIHLDSGGGSMFVRGTGGGHLQAMVVGGRMVTTGIDTSRNLPTAVENRPVNIAVRYLIKALP